jgi:hypothetical protein
MTALDATVWTVSTLLIGTALAVLFVIWTGPSE